MDDWDSSIAKVWKADATLLLHPSLPPPLNGVNPRTIMGKKWWDVKRTEAYEKHDWCCWACGIDTTYLYLRRLDAHEAYVFDGFEVRLDHIVALCTLCHAFIHVNRMNSMYDKGQIGYAECWEVENHGFQVLRDAGLPEKRFPTTNYSDRHWKDWYLLIDGVKHYSRFSGREEWKKEYN